MLPCLHKIWEFNVQTFAFGAAEAAQAEPINGAGGIYHMTGPPVVPGKQQATDRAKGRVKIADLIRRPVALSYDIAGGYYHKAAPKEQA